MVKFVLVCNKSSSIVHSIDLLNTHTLYVLWGDWFPKLCVVLSIIDVIIALIRKK